MTSLIHRLGDPRSLTDARTKAHAATQLLAKAARANASPAPDGSHTALTWSADRHALVTAPLGRDNPPVQLSHDLAPLSLSVLQAGEVLDTLPLGGQSLAQTEDWLDGQLEALGLTPASPITITYDLPDAVIRLDAFATDTPGLNALATWFALANSALSALTQSLTDLDPGPGPMLCWPHHFDIATYVALEPGDPETAHGIGVGLSPGDASYDQPYFYVTPWPQPDLSRLPQAIPPGHWHSAGFVGLIATGEQILKLDDPCAGTAQFLRDSFDAARALLSA